MRLAQIAHTASGLQYILGCVVFVKLHPQEVLADAGRKLARIVEVEVVVHMAYGRWWLHGQVYGKPGMLERLEQ